MNNSMSNQQGIRPLPTKIFFKVATLIDFYRDVMGSKDPLPNGIKLQVVT